MNSYSQTARENSPSRNYLYPLSSSRRQTSFSSLTSLKSIPEVESLHKEIQQLKKSLKSANQDLTKLKSIHDREINDLHQIFNDMKKEIEALKTTRPDPNASEDYDLNEYTSLAKEVITLRTEVDRITYLYNKERRQSSLRSQGDFN